MNWGVFLTFYFFFSQVTALEKWHAYSKGEQKIRGCSNHISRSLSFDKGSKYSYAKYCKNVNALSTLVGCLADVNVNDTKMFKYIQHECIDEYEIDLPMENLTNAYAYLVQNGVTWKLLKERKYNSTTEILNTPVFLNKTLSTLYVKAQVNFLTSYTNSMYYGIGAVSYWLAVCLVGGLANWSMIWFPSLRNSMNGRISKLWRKWITIPALFGKKQAAVQKLGLFSALVPSRIESVISLLFFGLLIGVNAAEIKYIDQDPIFKVKKIALLRYFSDRTGIVCVVLIPILLLFGGRNNFLMWLTRWKYSTFIAYHRWVGRWVALLAFLHSIGYTEYFIQYDTYASNMAETYVIWGVVGTACGCLILFQGLLYLRRNWYETFLVIHIVLAAFFVIGTWYHVIELGFAQVMIAAIVVWGFDRVVRVARVLHFGFPEAQVTLMNDKLEIIVPRPSHWKPIVGGYAWIYFGDKKYFWQSHPFTYMHDEQSVILYTTVHAGITQKIAQKLQDNPSGPSMKMRVSIEGPYGCATPIEHHSDVVFVAGGNGIPGMLNEFKHLLTNEKTKQRIKFNWIVKELTMFEEMAKHFAKLPLSNTEVNIFVTRQPALKSLMGSDESNDTDFKNEGKFDTFSGISLLQSDFPDINFIMQRPDLDSLVQRDIEEAANSVAFVTCGPPIMVDELRSVIVDKIDKTNKRVDFYDTLEVWT